MMMKRFIVSITVALMTNNLFAKSLKAMGESAKSELRMLGATMIGLGIMWAGFLYIKGGSEGKQKIGEVLTGAIFILGFAALVAAIRRVTG